MTFGYLAGRRPNAGASPAPSRVGILVAASARLGLLVAGLTRCHSGW